MCSATDLVILNSGNLGGWFSAWAWARETGNTPKFIEHLLAIPKAGDDDAFELPPRTRDFHPSEIDF